MKATLILFASLGAAAAATCAYIIWRKKRCGGTDILPKRAEEKDEAQGVQLLMEQTERVPAKKASELLEKNGKVPKAEVGVKRSYADALKSEVEPLGNPKQSRGNAGMPSVASSETSGSIGEDDLKHPPFEPSTFQASFGLSSSVPKSAGGDGPGAASVDDDKRGGEDALRRLGYYFDEEGILKQVKNGEKFQFIDQHHYEQLGSAITDEIYVRMIQHGLVPIKIPLNSPSGPHTKVFVTPKIVEVVSKKQENHVRNVLILIHGSGAVRAGQWARSLIINENISLGSMLPYIDRGIENGFEVIVTNGNDSSEKGVVENSTPDDHLSYVWKHIVRSVHPNGVAIVAHSAGGYYTSRLSAAFREDFQRQVFAIALTDSAHGVSSTRDRGKSHFVKVAQNWVVSTKPLGKPLNRSSKVSVPEVSAGHTKHEWTSGVAIEDVFQFILKKREEHELEIDAETYNGHEMLSHEENHGREEM